MTARAPFRALLPGAGKAAQELAVWACQMVLQARHWLPERELMLLADTGFAALELLATLSRRGVACITRHRLDAALYESASPGRPGTNGCPHTKGARLPNLPDALIRTSTRWHRVTVPRAGMAKGIAWLSSARQRPCGGMAGCLLCRSAESCCAIPSAGSRCRPYCAPAPCGTPCRSSAGSSTRAARHRQARLTRGEMDGVRK